MEVKNALDELEETEDASEVYKMAGNVLVKTEKAQVTEELEEKRSILKARLKSLEKKEKELRSEIEELNSSLSQMLRRESQG